MPRSPIRRAQLRPRLGFFPLPRFILRRDVYELEAGHDAVSASVRCPGTQKRDRPDSTLGGKKHFTPFCYSLSTW